MAWNSPNKKKRGPAGDIPMEKDQEMEHWMSNIMGRYGEYSIKQFNWKCYIKSCIYIYIHYIYGDIDWQ